MAASTGSVGSLIPIFGSILSAIPAVAVGLTQSPGTAFAVLAWIIGIHQLEANFLNPKIIGDSARIHPVLVVFSLLALSTIPVLRAIGGTVALGVASNFVLALLIVRRPGAGSAPAAAPGA